MKTERICCQTCGKNFLLTINQQKFYAEKGWKTPTHCPVCRAQRREERQTEINYAALMCGGPMRLYSRHGRGFFRKLGKSW